MNKKEKKQYHNIQCDAEIWKLFKIISVREGKNITEFIEEAIKEYVQNYNDRNGLIM